jgi:hypothetical protein
MVAFEGNSDVPQLRFFMIMCSAWLRRITFCACSCMPFFFSGIEVTEKDLNSNYPFYLTLHLYNYMWAVLHIFCECSFHIHLFVVYLMTVSVWQTMQC